MTARQNTYLIDWDGTLLDSYDAQSSATKRVFSVFEAVWDRARFVDMAADWRAHYRHAGIPEASLSEASELYRREYRRHALKLRAQARHGLRWLAENNGRLMLVTNAGAARVASELAATGLTGSFELVITADDVEQPKPSPAGFELALLRSGAPPECATAIGDTHSDELAAAAAGIGSELIASRYSTAEIVERAATDWSQLCARLSLSPVTCGRDE